MSIAAPLPGSVNGSPFDLSNDLAYQRWRDQKLANYPESVDRLVMDINDPAALSQYELAGMQSRLAQANLVIYRLQAAVQGKDFLRVLGKQLGLYRLDGNLRADKDGISAIQVTATRQPGEYIPYTDKPLSWHTDGYYNAADRQVRAIIMHCAQPAHSGGGNAFLDHEIAYIHLRDTDPEFINHLQKPDAMTIPANIQQGKIIRPEQSGSVFSVDTAGNLHMRYSARGRNIIWRNDPVTRAARQCLTDLLNQDSAYIFRHRLNAGEGIISNNVVHCRDAFTDANAPGQARLLYRARYFDRITGAGVS